MSLRTRLVAGLLLLAAVGLVLLAGVTYAEQRHFLYDRVDQQAKAAVGRPLPFGGGGAYGLPGGGDDHGGPAGPAAGTVVYERTASGDTTSACRGCYSTTSSQTPALPSELQDGEVTTI